MPDTERKYGTIVTATGLALVTAAAMEGKKVNITTLAVGDGGGAYYQPSADMIALKNECWRGDVNTVEINPASPNMIDVTAVVPADVGGFTIREMCVLTDNNEMVAICNTPDTGKVVIASGAAGEVELKMHIEVENAEVVQILIDPNVVTATKKDLERHEADPNAHGGAIAQATEEVKQILAGMTPIFAGTEEPQSDGPYLWLKVIQPNPDPEPEPPFEEEEQAQAVQLDIQDYREGSDLYVAIDDETKSVENAEQTQQTAEEEPLIIKLN